MPNKNWILVAIGVIVLLGLFILLKPKPQTNYKTVSQNIQSSSSSASSQTNTKIFELLVSGRKLVSGPETIKVNEEDTITIKIISDEPEELHIHGYDKSVDLQKDSQSEITFVANLTGRFEYELENSKTVIGALEVTPK